MHIAMNHLLIAACLSLPLAGQYKGKDASALQLPAADAQVSPELQALLTLETAFKQLADRTAPSVVTIAAYERSAKDAAAEGEPTSIWIRQIDDNYPGFRRIGSGSGVMVSEAGHLITNRHFLLKADGEPADLIDVETADNKHTIARIVGLEPTLNLAILQFVALSDGNRPQFKPVTFGNSFELFPGHWALAVGDPLGPEKYMGVGVFAGTPSRECYQEQLTATYLQAALRVHPGIYGGALINLKGEFVGMLTPRDPKMGIFDQPDVGVEFALPSNIIRGIYPSILANESRKSPWLGFAVMSPAELAKELGAEAFSKLQRPITGIYIENIFDPSPASSSGIRPGDFLTRFGNAYIGTPIDFQRQLYLAGIGSEVECEFFRKGETYTVQFKIEERPANALTR